MSATGCPGAYNGALEDFEDLVRCACGQRRVMLEIAVGPPLPGACFYVAP